MNKKIYRYFLVIPLLTAVISTGILGVYIFPDITNDETTEVYFILLLTFFYYCIILCSLSIFHFRPVYKFLKKTSEEEPFKKRLRSLPARIGGTTLIATTIWTYVMIYPNAMAGHGTHLIQYSDMLVLFFFTLVSFPSFLAYLLTTQISSLIMKNSAEENSVVFDPGKSNLWIKLLMFVIVISVMPIFYLFISSIHSELVINGVLSVRNESVNVRYFYIVVIAVIISLVIFISSLTLFGQMRSSISRLLKVIAKVQAGDLNVSAPVSTFDEIGLLTYNFNQMIGGLREREELKNRFGAYVSSEIAEYIMENKVSLEGEEREVTILFTDIAGYTSISENLSPKETVTLLNNYYNMLVEVIQNNRGVVNKFIGDSIMVIFNAPIDDPDHALNAIRCAREIVTITDNTVFQGGIKLSTRVGINSGTVIAGNLGSLNRHEYTVIGDVVNLAQRLEQLGKNFNRSILFSENTYNLISRELSGEYIGSVKVKGKIQAVKVYTA